MVATREYDDEKIRKVAILMSDGMLMFVRKCERQLRRSGTAFVRQFEGNGHYRLHGWASRFRRMCATVQYCATSPKHFYSATDGAELRKTFNEIAKRADGLRSL